MDISVIMASIREDIGNYPMATINSIINGAKNSSYDYEILHVSPYEINYPKVKWIEDTALDGSTSAFNIGYKYSSGKYVCIITDDWRMANNWWTIVDFIKTMPYQKQNKVASFFGGSTPHIFCADRQTIENDMFKGFLINPAYFHQYGDLDIGLQMKKIGEPVLQCPGVAPVTSSGNYQNDEVNFNQKKKYFTVDGITFNSMWAHVFGECKLYDVHEQSLDELKEISKQQLLKSRW